MTDTEDLEPELVHRFKNLLAITMSYCTMLLDELDANDPTRKDIQEMQKATQDAMAMLPELAQRLR